MPLPYRSRKRCLVRRVIRDPLTSLGQISQIKLPTLLGMRPPLLEAPFLLRSADVQEDLHDARAIVDEHPLKIIDRCMSLAHGASIDQTVDHRHEHVFVMRAIEHGDRTFGRCMPMHAP